MRSTLVLALAGLTLAAGYPAMAQDSVMVDETQAAADSAAPGQGELPIVQENGLAGLTTPGKEPDFFVVEGIAYNDLLNVREKASAGGKVRGRLPNGVALRNLGCGEFNGAKWCQVETLDEPRIVGWAAGRYMQESYVENAFLEPPNEARIETPADWEEQPPAVPAVAPTAEDAAPAETASPAEQGAEAPALAQAPADRDGEPATVSGVMPAGGDPAPMVAALTSGQGVEPPTIVVVPTADNATPAETASTVPQGAKGPALGHPPEDQGGEPPIVPDAAPAARAIQQSVASPASAVAPEARDATPQAEKMASLPAGGGLSSAEAASAAEPTAEPPAAGKRRPVNMTPLARNIAGWLVSRGMKIEGASPPEKVAGLPRNKDFQDGTPASAEGIVAALPAGKSAPTQAPAGQSAEPPATTESTPAGAPSSGERIASLPKGENAIAASELPVGQSAEPPVATERAQADAASSDQRTASLSPSESRPVKPTSAFAAIGEIPCARYYGQPMTRCVARVKRVGDSGAMITVAWPDGGQRVILFIDGRADNSDSPDTLTYTREADLNMIRIGKGERFEIPDALPFGG